MCRTTAFRPQNDRACVTSGVHMSGVRRHRGEPVSHKEDGHRVILRVICENRLEEGPIARAPVWVRRTRCRSHRLLHANRRTARPSMVRHRADAASRTAGRRRVVPVAGGGRPDHLERQAGRLRQDPRRDPPIALPDWAAVLLRRRKVGQTPNDLDAVFITRNGTWPFPTNVPGRLGHIRHLADYADLAALQDVSPHAFRRPVATTDSPTERGRRHNPSLRTQSEPE